MYKSITPLRSDEHNSFRYTEPSDFNFAKNTFLIPVTLPEIPRLCCEFPIVFFGEKKPVLTLITGIAETGNLAINSKGQWQCQYVPVFLRRYPFVPTRTEKDEITIGVDLESGCFSNPDGQRLFDEQGQLTDFFKKKITLMRSFDNQMGKTTEMIEKLEEYEILKASVLQIGKGNNGKKLGGFKLVDFKKLLSMDDKVLADWARKGWLNALSLQQLSLSHFDKFFKLKVKQ